MTVFVGAGLVSTVSRHVRSTQKEPFHIHKVQQCHFNRSKESARLRRSTSLSRSKARTTSGESGLEFFAVGLDDFMVVRWQKTTKTLRDTVTIQQPPWTGRSRH